MRNRRTGSGALRLACGLAALGLAVTGCSSEDAPGGSDGSSSSSSQEVAGPGPRSSVKLYTLEKPEPGVEGKDRKANEALQSFARAMSSGNRDAVEQVLYAPTPEDQSIVDQSLRIYEDADWDFSGARWTKDGVHGPCYLLQGEAADGTPVHMAGWAAWNDTLEEWEFGTLGLPGSPEYPDVPSC